MPDTKISALSTKATPTASDIIPIVDVSDNSNKKITTGSLPVSTFTQTALNAKVSTTGSETISGGKTFVPSALTDAATIATDAALANHFTVTLGGNRTLGNPTNPTAGQRVIWQIRQDGTGSRTLAFGTAFRFGTLIPTITLTTVINKTDYIAAIYNGTDSKWDIVAFSTEH